MTVARKPGHRGERGIIRKASRRESRIASAALYARVRFFRASLHTRPRVQRASGFPCALFLSRASHDAKLGRIAPRRCGRVFCCLKFESEDSHPRRPGQVSARTPIRDPYRVVLSFNARWMTQSSPISRRWLWVPAFAGTTPRDHGAARAPPRYFSVIASPLRSTFAIRPIWRPDSSSTAPFWLVSTMARAPRPTARPAPAAP